MAAIVPEILVLGQDVIRAPCQFNLGVRQDSLLRDSTIGIKPHAVNRHYGAVVDVVMVNVKPGAVGKRRGVELIVDYPLDSLINCRRCDKRIDRLTILDTPKKIVEPG